MKRVLALLLLIISDQFAIGQNKADDILTRESALEDLKILQTTLLECHPSAFRYTPKKELLNEFQSARNKLNSNVTVFEFSNLIAPIIADLHCGHTFTILPYVNDKRGLLPLEVRILNGKVYAVRNYNQNKDLNVGAELLEINGIPTYQLLNDFEKKSSGDGYGMTFKERTVEKYFRGKYAAYIGQPDTFRIKFKPQAEASPQLTMVAASSSESISRLAKGKDLNENSPANFYIRKENSTGVLTIRSFMLRNVKKQSGININKVIKNSFHELRKNNVKNLIIDIRWNTGGKTSIPPLLYSYLTDKKFGFKRKLLFRHGYKFSYPEYLNRSKLNDWINKKLDRRINDTTYEWTLHRNTKPYKGHKNYFKGNVYVLINGMTASAGAEFASLVRVNKRGVFVGEESGGDYNGVNGYDRTYVRLPHSKIGVLIAGWRSVMAWDEKEFKGHGVFPDYEVQPKLEDILNGQDTELNFIFSMIEK